MGFVGSRWTECALSRIFQKVIASFLVCIWKSSILNHSNAPKSSAFRLFEQFNSPWASGAIELGTLESVCVRIWLWTIATALPDRERPCSDMWKSVSCDYKCGIIELLSTQRTLMILIISPSLNLISTKVMDVRSILTRCALKIAQILS